MFLKPIIASFGLVCASQLARAQVLDGNTCGMTFHVDYPAGTSQLLGLFNGLQVYGMAADDANGVVFIAGPDKQLFKWNYGGPPPTSIGQFHDVTGLPVRVDGLAFGGGTLYASVEFDTFAAPDGIYEVNFSGPALIPRLMFGSTSAEIGGIGFNPHNGLIYGTNDAAFPGVGVGIVEIDLAAQTVVQIAPYPAGTGDFDGCTVGDGRVFLLSADAGDPIHVFNLASASYEAPLPSPISCSGFASGGAWTPSLCVGDLIGHNYCGPAVTNSSGMPGVISAMGSTSAAVNDVTLCAAQLPVGQFGFFITSETQGFFMPPGSSGFICLSGAIGRYNGNVGQGPTFTLRIDLTSMPVNPPQAVMPGDTWNFQAWYRDINNTSNFTDGVSILFL